MSFFSTTDIGRTTNRFSQDLQLVDMELPLSVLNTVLCKSSRAVNFSQKLMILPSRFDVYCAIDYRVYLHYIYRSNGPRLLGSVLLYPEILSPHISPVEIYGDRGESAVVRSLHRDTFWN